MEASILDQGITLMLVGMGTVFCFLAILVMAMIALSVVATRYSTVPATIEASAEEVAVIAAAIAQHRKS